MSSPPCHLLSTFIPSAKITEEHTVARPCVVTLVPGISPPTLLLLQWRGSKLNHSFILLHSLGLSSVLLQRVSGARSEWCQWSWAMEPSCLLLPLPPPPLFQIRSNRYLFQCVMPKCFAKFHSYLESLKHVNEVKISIPTFCGFLIHLPCRSPPFKPLSPSFVSSMDC